MSHVSRAVTCLRRPLLPRFNARDLNTLADSIVHKVDAVDFEHALNRASRAVQNVCSKAASAVPQP